MPGPIADDGDDRSPLCLACTWYPRSARPNGQRRTLARRSGLVQTRHGDPPRRRRAIALNGEGGIRTHGRCYPTHAFQACSFSRSDTSPRRALSTAADAPRPVTEALSQSRARGVRLRSKSPYGDVGDAFGSEAREFTSRAEGHRSIFRAPFRARKSARGRNQWKTERVGFEPTEAFASHDFESCRFNRAHAPLRATAPAPVWFSCIALPVKTRAATRCRRRPNAGPAYGSRACDGRRCEPTQQAAPAINERSSIEGAVGPIAAPPLERRRVDVRCPPLRDTRGAASQHA